MFARSLFCASVICLSALAPAADRDVEELLAKMRKAYSSAKTARVVTDSFLSLRRGGSIKTTVESVYLAPNKIRSTSTGIPNLGKPVVVISDGKSIVTEGMPRGQQRESWTLDNIARGLVANLELLSFWDWKRQLSTEKGANMNESKLKLTSDKWNGRSWIVLDEQAPKQKLAVRYFIDPKTSLIWRTVVSSTETKKVVQDHQCRSVQVGLRVDESRFKLPDYKRAQTNIVGA